MRVAAFATGTLASVVAAAALLRHLPIADLGNYALVLSLVAIIAGFSDLGLTAVGVRDAAVARERDRSRLLRELLGLRLTLSIAGLAVLAIVVAVLYTRTILYGVAIAGVALLFQVAQDNYSILLQVHLRFRWVAAMELARQVLAAALILLAAAAGAHLLVFVSVQVAVAVPLAVAAGALVRSERSLLPAFHLGSWRPLVARILPFSAAVAAAALYFQIALILVSLIASAHELGLFGASLRIIQVLSVVPALLVGAAFPIFAHAATNDHERLGYALGRVFEVCLIVGAWVAVSIAVGAPLVMSLIGGTKYAPAASILAIQGFALGATFVSVVWSYGLLALGLHRAILIVTASVLVGSTVLISLLVAVDGAHGAAIGTVVSESCAALGAAVMLVRRRPQLRPPLGVAPRVAAAALLGCVPLLLTGLPVIVRLVMSTALYASVILATGAVPDELRSHVPGFPARRREP